MTNLPIDSVICGKSEEVLTEFADDSVDCVISDLPYEWGFMSKEWDTRKIARSVYKQMCRVLKPGGLAFIMCGPRLDRLWRRGAQLEGAGFDIEFSPILWTYRSGFPKASDISKDFDKAAFRPYLETCYTKIKCPFAHKHKDYQRRKVECPECKRIVWAYCEGHMDELTQAMANKVISAAVNGEYFNPRGGGPESKLGGPNSYNAGEGSWSGEASRKLGTTLLASVIARFWEPLSDDDKHKAWAEHAVEPDLSLPPGVRVKVGEKQYASPAGNDENFGLDGSGGSNEAKRSITAPSVDLAKQYDGIKSVQLKPAWEAILICRKPLTPQAESAILILKLVETFGLNQEEPICERVNTSGDSSGKMGTSQSGSAAENTSLNTESSCNESSAGPSGLENNPTTLTESEMITGQKTSNSLPSPATSPTTIPASASPISGEDTSATLVENTSPADKAKQPAKTRSTNSAVLTASPNGNGDPKLGYNVPVQNAAKNLPDQGATSSTNTPSVARSAIPPTDDISNYLRLTIQGVSLLPQGLEFLRENGYDLIHRPVEEDGIHKEFILVAQKPRIPGPIRKNVEEFGVGGINVREAAIPFSVEDKPKGGYGGMDIGIGEVGETQDYSGAQECDAAGRFPANIIVGQDALGKEGSKYFSLEAWAEEHGFAEDESWLAAAKAGLVQIPKPSPSEKSGGLDEFVQFRGDVSEELRQEIISDLVERGVVGVGSPSVVENRGDEDDKYGTTI